MYPPAPELPGNLLGLVLTENAGSKKRVLLVGMERSEAVESIEEELAKINLHDILSGAALDALNAHLKGSPPKSGRHWLSVSAAGKKALCLADIAKVKKCKQGHPLQCFVCEPALWVESSASPLSSKDMEYTVSMVKPHCLEDNESLSAVNELPVAISLNRLSSLQ